MLGWAKVYGLRVNIRIPYERTHHKKRNENVTTYRWQHGNSFKRWNPKKLGETLLLLLLGIDALLVSSRIST
jgi:hypothetical protein